MLQLQYASMLVNSVFHVVLKCEIDKAKVKASASFLAEPSKENLFMLLILPLPISLPTLILSF